jgi:hypothetical protein
MATKDNLSEHIQLTVLLLTAVLASVDHGLCMLLVDDPQIPIDQRWRLTTKAGYTSEYTSGSAPRSFAADFWAQLRSATQLMFGRWVSADTEGYYLGGAPSEVMASYIALTASDGFSIAVEGIAAGAATDVVGMDFSDVVDIDDVLAEINTVMHTVATAAYADYDMQIDSLGRIFVSNPDDTGADSAQITIAAPSAGANMTTSSYLNFAGGSWIDGLDAETPVEALDAIRAVNDSWFCLTQRGASASQQIALAAYIQNLNKCAVLWESTYSNCNDPDSTTQAFARISALGYGKTMTIYDPGTLVNNPDAVIVGAYLPASEGTADWANWRLVGATSSNLGSTIKGVLNEQHIVYFETIDGITYNPYGLTANGDEMRWVVGAAWLFDAVQRAIFSAKLAAASWGFNIATFGKIDGIVRRYCNEAVTRGFCVNTTARPLTISVPDPDSFDAATRASHTAALGTIAQVYLDSAIYDMSLTIELAL